MSSGLIWRKKICFRVTRSGYSNVGISFLKKLPVSVILKIIEKHVVTINQESIKNIEGFMKIRDLFILNFFLDEPFSISPRILIFVIPYRF